MFALGTLLFFPSISRAWCTEQSAAQHVIQYAADAKGRANCKCKPFVGRSVNTPNPDLCLLNYPRKRNLHKKWAATKQLPSNTSSSFGGAVFALYSMCADRNVLMIPWKSDELSAKARIRPELSFSGHTSCVMLLGVTPTTSHQKAVYLSCLGRLKDLLFLLPRPERLISHHHAHPRMYMRTSTGEQVKSPNKAGIPENNVWFPFSNGLFCVACSAILLNRLVFCHIFEILRLLFVWEQWVYFHKPYNQQVQQDNPISSAAQKDSPLRSATFVTGLLCLAKCSMFAHTFLFSREPPQFGPCNSLHCWGDISRKQERVLSWFTQGISRNQTDTKSSFQLDKVIQFCLTFEAKTGMYSCQKPRSPRACFFALNILSLSMGLFLNPESLNMYCGCGFPGKPIFKIFQREMLASVNTSKNVGFWTPATVCVCVCVCVCVPLWRDGMSCW